MNLDTMVEHYVACALWSSLGDDGEPMDSEFDASDLSSESLEAARNDCRDFADANAADLEGMSPEQTGHDFWLTRNRHGAGFWDRGLGEVGDRLTKAAHVYGGVDLYVGDDGRIYGE